MLPNEALRQQVEEYGAWALLDELDGKRAELIEQYPFLAGVRRTEPSRVVESGDVNNLLHQARVFTENARRERKSQGSKRERRLFDEPFKDGAVTRIKKGEFLADVARDLGVWPSVLGSWCKRRGVKIPKMSREEHLRRLHGKVPVALLPPPGDGPKLNGSTKHAMALGLRVLQTMPDDGEPMHYKDIAKRMDHDPVATNWLIRRRREVGHIKPAGDKRSGMYNKTPKGLQWQQEHSAQ